MGIFGESLKEAFERIASEIGGRFIEGSLFKSPRIEVPWRLGHIYIDTYTQSTGQSAVTYTRVRCAYKTDHPFDMKVYKKGAFSNMGKALGMQDIEIGQSEFDESFIIKGDDERLIRAVLNQYNLQNALMALPKTTLVIKHKDPLCGKAAHGDEQLIVFYQAGALKETDVYQKMLYALEQLLEGLSDNACLIEEPTQTVLYK